MKLAFPWPPFPNSQNMNSQLSGKNIKVVAYLDKFLPHFTVSYLDEIPLMDEV